jgi:hypothetical protein
MSIAAVTPDQFQYIKLPDGSYGKFRADASDEQIRGAVSKDFPDVFKPKAAPQQPSTWQVLTQPRDKTDKEYLGYTGPAGVAGATIKGLDDVGRGTLGAIKGVWNSLTDPTEPLRTATPSPGRQNKRALKLRKCREQSATSTLLLIRWEVMRTWRKIRHRRALDKH